jgi:hypothetical protein
LFHRRCWYWLLVFVILFTLILHAENGKYVLGTNINLTAGDANSLGYATQNANQPLVFFYGIYPTLRMAASGRRSSWSTSYSYGLDRTATAPTSKHESHAAMLTFSSRISSAWNIHLYDSFDATSDAATFNALRNVVADPNVPFVFYPTAAQITARGNTASLGADYRFADRSTVSFNVRHALRDYGSGGAGSAAAALANQQSFSGDMAYNYQTGAHETWSLGYTASYFNFSGYSTLSQFQNGYSQTGHLGYANQIVPGLTFNLSGGVSRVQGQGTGESSIGFDSAATLQKKIDENRSFSLYFRRSSADTSGLGSVSKTNSGGVSFTRAGRKATLFSDLSVFDTRGILGSTYNSRGYAATVSVGIPLTRTWSAQVGGLYQRYEGLQAFAFTQKRVFVSLRYSNPSLKRF